METQVKVNFWDGVEQKMESRVFNLSLNGSIQDSSFHKMAVKKTIENLDKRVVSGAYLDPRLASVPNIYTKLAVAYQVLSADHTAFICVIDEINKGSYFPTKNVIIPNLLSVDYQKEREDEPLLYRKCKRMRSTAREITEVQPYCYKLAPAAKMECRSDAKARRCYYSKINPPQKRKDLRICSAGAAPPLRRQKNQTLELIKTRL